MFLNVNEPIKFYFLKNIIRNSCFKYDHELPLVFKADILLTEETEVK